MPSFELLEKRMAQGVAFIRGNSLICNMTVQGTVKVVTPGAPGKRAAFFFLSLSQP